MIKRKRDCASEVSSLSARYSGHPFNQDHDGMVMSL